MTTLKNIADIANVSISTVSKALRNKDELNVNTVNRIRKIADRLNYPYQAHDNQIAKETVIGIVCPEILSLYYADIVNSFQNHVRKSGFDTIVTISGFSEIREHECIKTLLKNNVAAIVCFTENDINTLKMKQIAEANDIVFLFVTTACDDISDFDNICIDDFHSTLIAINHLIDLGHKNIAYIGDYLSKVRKDAFISVLQSNGLPVINELIVESNFRFEKCGYEGMQTIFSTGNLPSGIFAAYDNIAIGAMRAIFEKGLLIPEDMSVISIDNITTSAYLYKNLTTVTGPTSDLGKIASSLIIGKIKNKGGTVQSVILKPTLVIRETTGFPQNK